MFIQKAFKDMSNPTFTPLSDPAMGAQTVEIKKWEQSCFAAIRLSQNFSALFHIHG